VRDSAIPHWLSQEQHYKPLAGRDRFIDKTVLSLSALLSRAMASRQRQVERTRIMPELRLLSLLMFVLLVSLSRGFVFVSSVLVLLLALLSLLNAESIIRSLRTAFIAALFSFLILLPSVYFSGFTMCVLITLKLFATVTAVCILTETSRWDLLTQSARILPVPQIFILVLDVSVRYIVLLGELSLEMFRALKLRSVGCNNDSRGSVAAIAGSVFVSSRAMAEDMYAAMACRGFTGEYRVRRRIKPAAADFVFVLANAGLVWFFVLYGGAV
jgi:cobalt/nickel transport system permease protein